MEVEAEGKPARGKTDDHREESVPGHPGGSDAAAAQSLRAWAEVDLDALRGNARAVRQAANGADLIAIVKADAYGHGAGLVVPALEDEVAMFGVANVDEAEQLDTGRPVLLLSPSLPADRERIVGGGFIPSISSYGEAEAFERMAARAGRVQPVHAVVDTAMGRMGMWKEGAAGEIARIGSLPHLRLDAVATHLPSADEEPEFTESQLRGFDALVAELGSSPGGIVPSSHVLNSAGVLRFPGHAGRMVRVGLALYGVSPLAGRQHLLRPVMRVCARVVLVRELGIGRTVSYGRTFRAGRPTLAATLAIGYADGYPRTLSGRGTHVLLRGRRCPVIGRVTMDQIVVDATGLDGVEPGDPAVLLGRQGGEEIGASELAERAGTIPWEILTGIQQRVVRIPTGGGA